MLAQYVLPSKLGLFRIVRHGRRWRSLLDERELGRHDGAGAALAFLRDRWPRARLPMSLDCWRYLPAPAHARAQHAATSWRMVGC